mgnify:CR=1 FL=1
MPIPIYSIKNLQTWDYAYYSEKMKKMLFDFDEEELRPYFKSENVINGVFEVANKLYGITFDRTDEIPVWHKDVETYKAIDEKGEYLGLLYVDLYPRATKKGGAWMDEIRSYGLVGEDVKKPHICFICNLTKSTKTQPSLLSFSEVTTIFHEFGHCLFHHHGLPKPDDADSTVDRLAILEANRNAEFSADRVGLYAARNLEDSLKAIFQLA